MEKKRTLASTSHNTEKNYLKWTINLNIKAKTMKLLEESIADFLCNLT